MLSIENRCGRLLEIRVEGHVGVDEIDPHRPPPRLNVPGGAVICVDARHARVMDRQTAAAIVGMLGRTAHAEREAILVPADNAVVAMQIARIVREANDPTRRTFETASDAVHWLEPALDAKERARLMTFLVSRPRA